MKTLARKKAANPNFPKALLKPSKNRKMKTTF
jgi:hypothetical protein